MRFEDMEAIKRTVTKELKDISEESFRQCIVAWQRRMEKFIKLKEDDFKGESMGFVV